MSEEWWEESWVSLDARVDGVGMSGAGLCSALQVNLRAFWEGPEESGDLLSDRRNFTLRLGRTLPDIPPGVQTADLNLMESRVAAAWTGDELWLGSALHVQVSGGGAQLTCLPEAPLAAESLGVGSLAAWSLAFTEAHRAGGWLPLHAAVVARNGVAVAVTGESGAGKSTATLRLLAQGFQVLAEDRAFWHAPSSVVVGLDRHVRAFEDSVARFAPGALEAARSGPRDAKGKCLLPLDSRGAAHLTRILHLSSGGGTLDSAGRVRLAWEMTGVPLTALARQRVQAGVTQLLPLLDPQGITRETVVPAVTAWLTRVAPGK